MKSSFCLRLVLTGAALSFAASAAQAGPLWSFQVQPITLDIHSDLVLYPLGGSPPPPLWPVDPWPPPHSGEAELQLKGAHGGANGSAGPMTMAWVTPHSLAPDILPGNFTDSPWGLKLTITDNFLHKSGTLLFTGVFDGTVSKHHVALASTTTSQMSQDLLLGGPFIFDSFTVTLERFIPPHGCEPGRFVADIDFHRLAAIGLDPPGCGGPMPNESPEPSTLALVALGLGAVGLVRRFRG
jgi:hypothetical protein